MFLSDFSYAALMAFMPLLLSEVGAKIDNDLQIYGTILSQDFLGIPGTLISAYLVTTFLGKRWTSSGSFILTALCVFIFLTSTSYWMVLLSTSLIYFFNFMGYASLMAILQESYPVSIRALGVGWANSWCRFGGVLSPITVGLLFGVDGGMALSVLIISLSFGAVGLVSAFLPEPQDWQEEESSCETGNFVKD